MKSIAIIPLRKESKGIPEKNKKKILGRPLYQWVLSEAIFSDLDEIYVFTDDDEILSFISQEYTWASKVKGFKRSEESAKDTASNEFGMIELAGILSYNFDIFCLLQATSPLTTAKDINACLDKIKKENFDSALSVVESKHTIWNIDGIPNNLNSTFLENSAIYTTTKQAFQKTQNKISGKIGIYEMPDETLFEINKPHDFEIVEKLLEMKLHIHKQNLKKIKAMVFDVDGVLTNGTVLTGIDSEIAKPFSLRDGMGFDVLKANGIIPIVMTSEQSPIVHTRMKKLNIQYYFPFVKDKFSRLSKELELLGINRNEVAYVGDDINDMCNLKSVGWSFCPANGLPQIANSVDIKLLNNGGDMAVREAIEFIVRYNGRF
jgi:YrbI family 3-deoxy-D-manno-octulosonate 8-phosphate phosphatase